MSFLQILRRLKKKIFYHQPLVEILIYQKNLQHNLQAYQKNFPGLQFAPVLKSNAYGHGLVEVAKILDKEDSSFLVVDSFFEARTLRHAGIKSKILIIGFVRSQEIARGQQLKNISFTVASLEQLQELADNLKSSRHIHLKIDTGMHRQGILMESVRRSLGEGGEIETATALIKKNKNIVLEGVCSHLADADNEDESFTLKQIEAWNRAAQTFHQNFGGPDSPSLKYFHLSASAGTRFVEKIDANVARLGLGLYGINALSGTDNKLNLKPVLEMRTIITAVKEIEVGEKVGYGATFTADKKIKIATVPVGYFEGVDRRLSNCGSMLVQNQPCPIIGRVSMNITTIDVSAVANVKVGDEAIVISAENGAINSVENIARQCNTIPYEILVHIPQYLKRFMI